ncbi:hypothetical protein [Planococcus halocryophilus]|uniref:hypothetical protein n=1 Tax=Planococcus halocryophilus TaxID=1215089 RepID=UPI001F114824|nr:hypothetical protein [Planococcus halocryophilus]MCH4825776.1 hypothetical protein [Planococcus halocryophilus]
MYKAQYLLYSIASGLLVLSFYPVLLPAHITLGITTFVVIITLSELFESVLDYKEPSEEGSTFEENINNNALSYFYLIGQLLMYASVPIAIYFSYYSFNNFSEAAILHNGQTLTLVALAFTILIIAQFKNE